MDDVTVIREGTGQGSVVGNCRIDMVRAVTSAFHAVVATALDYGASPPELTNAAFTTYLHLLCNIQDFEGAKRAIERMLDNLPDTYPMFHQDLPTEH